MSSFQTKILSAQSFAQLTIAFLRTAHVRKRIPGLFARKKKRICGLGQSWLVMANNTISIDTSNRSHSKNDVVWVHLFHIEGVVLNLGHLSSRQVTIHINESEYKEKHTFHSTAVSVCVITNQFALHP
jgi:hypothetical protein